MGGPGQTLAYLSRYTHRTAIGNEHIKTVTAGEVVLTARANDHGTKRTELLPGQEFCGATDASAHFTSRRFDAGLRGVCGQTGGDAVFLLKGGHAQGGGDVGRVRSLATARQQHGRPTQRAAVKYASTAHMQHAVWTPRPVVSGAMLCCTRVGHYVGTFARQSSKKAAHSSAMQAISAHSQGTGLVHNPSGEIGDWFKSPIAQTKHATVSAAVQSNMVYLPRFTSSLCAHTVARLINADCWALFSQHRIYSFQER